MLARFMRYVVASAAVAGCGYLASAGLAGTVQTAPGATETTATAVVSTTAASTSTAETSTMATTSPVTTVATAVAPATTAATTVASVTGTTNAVTTSSTRTTAASRRPARGGRNVAPAPIVVARARLVSHGCAAATPLLITPPGRAAFSVGPLAARSLTARSGATHLTYPVAGAIARFGSVRASAIGCGARLRASVTIRSLVLFDGAVRARALSVSSSGSATSWRVRGLRILGKPASASARFKLGAWGILLVRAHGKGGAGRAMLRLRLRRSRAGLPAGTIVEVASLLGVPPAPAVDDGSAVVRAARAVARRARSRPDGPLTVTPELDGGPYTFPLMGEESVYDSYGAARSDTGWHHGDDLFAPLGTPVLAVADGTVFTVGWEELGGWRLWLKDKRGNRFYYAHLSAYTGLARNGTHVRAGQVLGFVGNTGDAITTPYHLHFEIHPKPLHWLGYDGAVDPTRYLDAWKRVPGIKAPPPVLDPPGGPPAADQRLIARRELIAVAQGGIHAEMFLGRPPKVRSRLPADGSPPPEAGPRSLASPRAHAVLGDVRAGSRFDATSIAVALVSLLSALASTALRWLGPRRGLAMLLLLGGRIR
jgi:murein DD-endopeptidase MepM/ murein hydrolase activator NlpD